jgi:hypothetical protein
MTQARGPFKLPLTSPQIAGVDQVVTLGSGGIYYVPSGNYLFTNQSSLIALQWFDPLAMMWRPISSGCPNMLAFNCDGANYRLCNISGTIVGATITNGGTGGTNGIGPVETGTIIVIEGVGTGSVTATAEGYAIIGGSVPVPTIVRPGSGFVVPPVVCCDPPPPGGVQATFIATINATGGIATVTQVTAGAGYKSVPQFYIIPQFKYYPGAPRWPGDSPAPMPQVSFPPRWPWPAPGLIDQQNVWPGTEYQPNIDNVKGALIIGNPLTGSGTLTGVVVTYGGSGYDSSFGYFVQAQGGTLSGQSLTPMYGSGPGGGQPSTAYLQAMVN